VETGTPGLLRSVVDIFILWPGSRTDLYPIGESTRRDHGKKVLRYPVRCKGCADETKLATCLLRHPPSLIRAVESKKRCELHSTRLEGVDVDSGRGTTQSGTTCIRGWEIRAHRIIYPDFRPGWSITCQRHLGILGVNGCLYRLRQPDLSGQGKQGEHP